MRLWCQVPTTANEESFVAPTELGRRFKGIWRDGVNSRENKIPAVGQPRSGRVVGLGQDKERNGISSPVFGVSCFPLYVPTPVFAVGE